MKKLNLLGILLAGALVTSCGSIGSLGSLGSGTSTSTSSSSGTSVLGSVLGGVVNSVLGGSTITQESLVGTWKYYQPGCAFTSDNLLAKAGGEVAANDIRNKLSSTYSNVGVSSSNTYFTFNSDNTFSGQLRGTPISGTYTYDQSKNKVTMKALLFSLPCYVKRTTSGMSFLFESKKLLSAFQTISALSGNTTAQAIGEISKNYDGVRLGFDMKK